MSQPPRARGALEISAKQRDGLSVISDLRQEGSLKALFPNRSGPALEAVFLNTAGGLTGGDRMDIAVSADAGSTVNVSSQAAERVYRAPAGQCASAAVNLRLGPDARINWLPQETILFDAAALERRLTVDLASDARVLIVEPLIFGRTAMGEVVNHLHFVDHWRVRRAGQLIFADAVRIVGDIQGFFSRRAIAGSAGAMATILLAAPEASAYSDICLPATAGLSLLADDLLLVRILAEDGFALRAALIPVIETLSQTPLPRVWRL